MLYRVICTNLYIYKVAFKLEAEIIIVCILLAGLPRLPTGNLAGCP